mmetsp:Transcript_5016/g.12708  ORF Transcript_5016/g.12708 Transcript_5016/m.12708 type:complete len:349 (-) Transcript_5016:272-1318(-)
MKNSSPSLLQPGSISLVSDSVDGDDNDQNNNSNRNNNNNTTRNKSDNEDTNAEAMLDNILEAPPLPSSNVAAAATTTTRTGTAKTGESPAATKKSTSVFDRLYSSHTAASKSHSSGAPPAKGTTPNSNTKMKRSYARPSPKAQHLTPTKLNYAAGGSGGAGAQSSPPSSSPTSSSSFRRTPVKDRGIKSPAAVLKSATGRKHSMEYSIRMKPLTKLYFISKFHPGVGLEPIEPIKLGYTFFQSFCDYENGAMDEGQISKEIIVAFFKQDFPSGRHWQMNEPTTSLVPSKSSSTSSSTETSSSSSYVVSMSATYDWEDAYRVATARGIVHFKNKEIRVENYAYDLTGDP